MTTLKVETITLPAATLGPENPLPRFRESENREIRAAPDVSPEERRYLGWQIGHRVLPYRMQDDFDLNRRPKAFKAIVLENEFLKATFFPELGGRMVSLLHKPEDRELLSRNPVFQPGNLALRGAWFSGGIEWNPSHFGHHYLTCSPVFAAQIEGLGNEPALRLYEWDRVKCFPWQIDFHLPPGSRFLFARARLVNPHEREIPMYWWTNIAVPETPDTRVIAPARTTLAHIPPDQIAPGPMPVYDGKDVTYAVNFQTAREFFFRIADDRRPWVAALDRHGRGLVEVSTARLRGRKAFYWGMSQGGRRWQESLNGSGAPHLEIQAGLACTQLESVPMPARTEWNWTEAFGLIEADPERVHGSDWSAALGAMEKALETRLPRQPFEEMHSKLGDLACRPPEKVLFRGSGWGALERRRAAARGEPDRIPPELAFDETTLGPAQEPWLALLARGELPESPPAEAPAAWMVQDEWYDLLEAAVHAGRGDHWLSWLHLGNARMEALDPAGARAAWEKSVERAPSGWALRNLALLAHREQREDAARELLARAWRIGPRLRELAVEYARALADAGEYAALRDLMAGLPGEMSEHERIAILAARAALKAGDLDAVEPIFHRSFATIREGETSLTDIWFEYHERRIAAAQGAPVDDALRRRVRKEFPPPRTIDFRMGAS